MVKVVVSFVLIITEKTICTDEVMFTVAWFFMGTVTLSCFVFALLCPNPAQFAHSLTSLITSKTLQL